MTNVAAQTAILSFGEGNHAIPEKIPEQFRDLPVVAIIRDPVSWVESVFSYSSRRGWNDKITMERTSQAETVDQFALNLMRNHPYLYEAYWQGYCEKADIVIDYGQLIPQASLVLETFGLKTQNIDWINASTKEQFAQHDTRQQWMLHNASLYERCGWPLPPGPVYALADWTGWWSTTCHWLQSRFLGKRCRFLEIGVCEGRSAAIAAETFLRHPQSTYDGVDLWKLNPRLRAQKNISLAMRDKQTRLWDFPLGPVDQAFETIYIDGDHGFDGCLADLEKWWPRLVEGGYLIVDDYGSEKSVSDWPKVKQATDFFFQSTPHIECYVPGQDYQKVVQKPLEKRTGS